MKKNALFLLLFGLTLPIFAQETKSIKVPNHGYPKIQTYTPEQIKQFEQTPSVAQAASAFGNLPAGTPPTPSPESAVVNRFKDISVNLFTGTAVVPLPLYTFQEGSLGVPIGLGYNASGMKTHEVASWSGVNWALSAGGMISRQVRGLPDEGKLDLPINNTWTSSILRKGYYRNGFNATTHTVNDDTEPDVFYLNINGQTYKFMYKFSGEPRFIFFPDADIKVIAHFDYSSAVGRFIKFEVFMPDGTKYIFGDGAYEKSAEVDVKYAQEEDIYPGASRWNHYWKNEAVTSAWYLTKIVSVYGEEINFEYDNAQYSFFKVAEDQSTAVCPTPAQVDKKINKVYVEGASLNRIYSTHKKVEFNKGLRTCYIFGDRDYCHNNLSAPRLDIDSWTATPLNQTYAKQLIQMTVMDNVAAPTDTLKYQFSYGHFSAVENDLPAGYTTADVGFTHQRRLRLERVTLPDKSFYRFRYNGDDPDYNGKSRLNYGVDHWGFSNGVTNNRLFTGLIPRDSFFPTCTALTSDRETDASFAFAGSLDSIIVSTGSQTKLIYELHQARNYTNGSIYKPIGGARIKEVRNKDLISGIETIKSYSYLMADGVRPSGFLCMKPIYRFKSLFNESGSNSGIYDRLVGEIGRPVVGYNRVEEQVKDGLGTPLGRTVHTFDQDTSDITTERIDPNCTGTFPNRVCDTVRYYRPELIVPGLVNYHDFRGGNPLKTEVFNQNNDTLSVQSYIYMPSNNYQERTFATKVFKVNGFNIGHYSTGGNYFLVNYDLYFTKYRPKSQTSKVFSQTGTNPITTTQNITYKDEMSNTYRFLHKGKHNFPVLTTTTDGQGHIIENLSQYIADIGFGLDTLPVERTCYDFETETYYRCDTTEYIIHIPRAGSQARGIYELQNRHILAANVQSIAINNGRITGASYNRYAKINVGGGVPPRTGFDYFLKEQFTFGGIGELSGDPDFLVGYFNREENDTINRDPRYFSVIDYQAYNPLGMPKRVKPFGGAVSGTDYDVSNLLPLRSMQNIGGSIVDTTTYEYAQKIFGLSRQISPNKLAINYAYYSNAEQNKIGQLKQTTDKDGNVLAHYEYPYLNQTLQGTAGTFSTDITKNRVVSRTPRIATTNVYQDFTKVSTSVSYADGSGRSLQSVGYKLSPTGKDLLSSTPKYDTYGRPQRNILPVASNIGTGQYQPNAQSLAQTFYGDAAPYSEVTQYEQSPLSRTFKGIGVGAAFRPNKESEQKFETGNFGLPKYELDINGTLQIGSYSGNEVFKSTGIDEQGQQSISFTDRDGRTLESRVQFTGDGTQASHYLITTYVHDYLGRAVMVIPPKLYGAIPNNTDIATSPYLVGLYFTKYDERNRVVEKHTPNAGWSYMVYNRLGLMVMSQNSRLRTKNQWLFTQYDAFGRTARSGVLTNATPRADLQIAFDNNTATNQYVENGNTPSGVGGAFPAIVPVAETDLMSINYYDDYSWKNPTELPYIAYKSTRYPNAKGLLTGTKVRRLDTQAWLRSAMYYDDKNRLIQSQSENRFGTASVPVINQTDMVFDFIGQLLEERTIYRKPSQADIENRTVYTYDHAGRKTQATNFFTGLAPELLATYEYDELGRMITKNLNEARQDIITRQNETTAKGTTDIAKKYILILPSTQIKKDSVYLAFIASGLQKVTYTYNIKGNLRGINLTPAGALDVAKVFSLKLDYYEDGRFYNGLLSKQTWATKTDNTPRSFLYDYDKANRFTNAQFAGKGSEDYSLSNLTYDPNGNIETLNRNSKTGTNSWGTVDNLTYSYANSIGDPNYANQLLKVEDTGASTGIADFKNGFSGIDEYGYYPDGSLKFDKNKGIDSIRYNYLGLPNHIFFDPDKYIENVYTADGIKLSQKIVNGSVVIQTDYIGDLIYRNDTLLTIAHDEGIIKRKPDGSYKYQYFIADHLGNTRVIFEKLNDTTYTAQANHYGAWGEVLQGLGTQGDWQFLFQGKEYVDAFGYNSYDFGTRQYDQNLGLMRQIDGANQFASGYTGMGNMPTVGIDPDGQLFFAIPQIGWSKRGGLSLGLEIGVGIPGALSASVTGGYNFGSKQGYWSAQGYASGFYAGYGSQGGFAGWGYRYAGFSAGVSYGREGLGVGLSYGGTSNNFNGAIGVGWSQRGGFDFSMNGGYTQRLGSSISTTEFVHSTELSESITPTDANLHDVMSNSDFGGDYMKKFNITELTTENMSKLPTGFTLKDGFLMRGGVQIGGITINKGNKSRILMSPGIFEHGKFSIYVNTGHEFVHAYHNSLGLTSSKIGERVAYDWSANATFNYQGRYTNNYYFYQGKGKEYFSGTVPNSYILPNWFAK